MSPKRTEKQIALENNDLIKYVKGSLDVHGSGNRDILLDLKKSIHGIVIDVNAIKIQQGIDHFILKEHESRSTTLEKRLGPLEADAKFARRLVALIVALGGCWEIVKLFIRL